MSVLQTVTLALNIIKLPVLPGNKAMSYGNDETKIPVLDWASLVKTDLSDEAVIIETGEYSDTTLDLSITTLPDQSASPVIRTVCACSPDYQHMAAVQ